MASSMAELYFNHNHDFCFELLNLIICDICPLVNYPKKFHFNIAFELSCIGNNPPQAFMVSVDRFQDFNSISAFFINRFIVCPVVYIVT